MTPAQAEEFLKLLRAQLQALEHIQRLLERQVRYREAPLQVGAAS